MLASAASDRMRSGIPSSTSTRPSTQSANSSEEAERLIVEALGREPKDLRADGEHACGVLSGRFRPARWRR